MAIKSPVLSKASLALRALERLLSGVMADVSHQRTFFPEASQAELTHVRFLITMSPLMDLQGILKKTNGYVRDPTVVHFIPQFKEHKEKNI